MSCASRGITSTRPCASACLTLRRSRPAVITRQTAPAPCPRSVSYAPTAAMAVRTSRASLANAKWRTAPNVPGKSARTSNQTGGGWRWEPDRRGHSSLRPELPPGRWYQGSKSRDESERVHLDRRSTIQPRPLELETDVSVVEDAEPVIGQRRAQDVAAQPFPPLLVVGGDAGSGL